MCHPCMSVHGHVRHIKPDAIQLFSSSLFILFGSGPPSAYWLSRPSRIMCCPRHFPEKSGHRKDGPQETKNRRVSYLFRTSTLQKCRGRGTRAPHNKPWANCVREMQSAATPAATIAPTYLFELNIDMHCLRSSKFTVAICHARCAPAAAQDAWYAAPASLFIPATTSDAIERTENALSAGFVYRSPRRTAVERMPARTSSRLS